MSAPAPVRATAPKRQDLAAQAARLWPEQPDLQRRWLRAVSVVRATRRGWLLDARIGRAQ